MNLSSCWSQRQGCLQNWLAGWERDYGSVPSAGRQKIQAVQDFLDIRKRFHDICKDPTVYDWFHAALTAYSKQNSGQPVKWCFQSYMGLLHIIFEHDSLKLIP